MFRWIKPVLSLRFQQDQGSSELASFVLAYSCYAKQCLVLFVIQVHFI
jgi:hypothetical protein